MKSVNRFPLVNYIYVLKNQFLPTSVSLCFMTGLLSKDICQVKVQLPPFLSLPGRLMGYKQRPSQRRSGWLWCGGRGRHCQLTATERPTERKKQTERQSERKMEGETDKKNENRMGKIQSEWEDGSGGRSIFDPLLNLKNSKPRCENTVTKYYYKLKLKSKQYHQQKDTPNIKIKGSHQAEKQPFSVLYYHNLFSLLTNYCVISIFKLWLTEVEIILTSLYIRGLLNLIF